MGRFVVIVALSAALIGCDAGPKATATRDAAPTAAQLSATQANPQARSDPGGASSYAPRAPVRLVAGKPVWSSNRQMSAEDNARSHFERDGGDFGAKTLDDYVAKAHAFTAKPPKGAQRLQRPNGDVLLYDEPTNTFAVMSREGAPRTMFKPRNGPGYWQEQIRREKEKSGRY